ncbi:DUF7253 family protein [Anaerorhabdus sp.]|uniref:DUF7253 family protein n=1 Tax=Anaerorhabdus sp. TaxID=1872524 RepID=UPI003FA57A1E
MAKYSGWVGYITQIESSPGVWTDSAIARKMRGDAISQAKTALVGDSVHDDVTINNRISIVADPYAYDNFMNIKYVEYMKINWKVTSIDIQRPRIILTLGGVWNGPVATS